MDTIIKNILIFAGGAAVGTFIGYKIAEKKFEEEVEYIYEDEDDELEEYDDEEYDDDSKPKYAEVAKFEKPSITEIRSELDRMAKEHGYIPEEESAETESPSEEDEPINGEYPYIISPEEYGEDETYDTVSLILYEDGVLADAETDEKFRDSEECIGWDNIDEMGKYEEDAIHIRNAALATDYEILRSEKYYRDIIGED